MKENSGLIDITVTVGYMVMRDEKHWLHFGILFTSHDIKLGTVRGKGIKAELNRGEFVKHGRRMHSTLSGSS